MNRLGLIIISFILFTEIGFSQTTILNTPSTDVLAKGNGYVEANFVGHLDKYSNGGFQGYGFKGIYGLSRKLEVGINLCYVRNGINTPTEISPNFKVKAYENEKHKFTVSGGTSIYIPLNKAAGNHSLAMVYSNASKQFTKVKGMKVTFGGYGLIGAKKEEGSRMGVMVGIEQPLFKRVNLIGDWFSGKNRFGYSAVGLSIAVTKRQSTVVSYNFGNHGKGNNALAISYGYSF